MPPSTQCMPVYEINAFDNLMNNSKKCEEHNRQELFTRWALVYSMSELPLFLALLPRHEAVFLLRSYLDTPFRCPRGNLLTESKPQSVHRLCKPPNLYLGVRVRVPILIEPVLTVYEMLPIPIIRPYTIILYLLYAPQQKRLRSRVW